MALCRKSDDVMLPRGRYYVVTVFMALIFIGMFSQSGETTHYKVLVVMSDHETMPFTMDIKKGIETLLAQICELQYVYLDTALHFEGGQAKAEEAYALYQTFQPDGVIAVGDNAQFLFVGPYLKEKVDTPVIFCAVNAPPENHGYPASNVTGVLERVHFKESIALVQQLVPSVKTIGYIMRRSPTASSFYRQVRSESSTYTAESLGVRFPHTLEEAKAIMADLSTQCDVLFIDLMEGLLDEDGQPLASKDVIPVLVKIFGKPTICSNESVIKLGVLCAVVKTGEEQGSLAAEMLLKALEGTPISELPITRNYQGKRMINANALKALGIKPKLEVLVGAELVKSEE